jgi:hypothetical protein
MYFPSVNHLRDESSIHNALEKYRVKGKEFFLIELEEALDQLVNHPELSTLRSKLINASSQNENKPD